VTAHPSAVADVLVVGGGPAGAATAISLARDDHRVVVLERGNLPHHKACGALITPRAATVLAELELDLTDTFHRIDQVRITFGDRSTSIPWPSHPLHPNHGFVARRDRFDGCLADAMRDAGVTILAGHEATSPIVDRGFVRGAHVTDAEGAAFETRADYTVVADGAYSRFGRALGTFREPTWPSALAHRGIYRSALHDAAEIELMVDLRDRAGTPITGYGWMFPRGDGTVNVGVLILSTSPSFRVINPAHLLERFVHEQAPRWHLDTDAVVAPAGGRIPMGLSVGPAAGPTYLTVGDAVGAANPLSGAGIEYALETGRLAATVLDDALATGTAAALQRYPQLLADRYGSYYKVGRLVDRMLGSPTLSRRFGQLAAGQRSFTDAVVRIAGNELRPGRAGRAETAYRVGRAISLFGPNS
jgi:geranylgeranyl reductase family protein